MGCNSSKSQPSAAIVPEQSQNTTTVVQPQPKQAAAEPQAQHTTASPSNSTVDTPSADSELYDGVRLITGIILQRLLQTLSYEQDAVTELAKKKQKQHYLMLLPANDMLQFYGKSFMHHALGLLHSVIVLAVASCWQLSLCPCPALCVFIVLFIAHIRLCLFRYPCFRILCVQLTTLIRAKRNHPYLPQTLATRRSSWSI